MHETHVPGMALGYLDPFCGNHYASMNAVLFIEGQFIVKDKNILNGKGVIC